MCCLLGFITQCLPHSDKTVKETDKSLSVRESGLYWLVPHDPASKTVLTSHNYHHLPRDVAQLAELFGYHTQYPTFDSRHHIKKK